MADEHAIQELMEQTGMTRTEAVFALAVDEGDIDGDMVELDEGEDEQD